MAGYNINIGIKTIGAAASALSIKELASTFVKLSDAASQMNARLAQTNQGVGQSGLALENVRRIANETRTSITEVSNTYAKLSFSLGNYGANQTQVARVTETLTKSLKIMGATTAEVDSVLGQMAQTFNKGFLNDDEFKTLREAAPKAVDLLVRHIAESTGRSVNEVRAGLAKMAKDGKLSVDLLVGAWGENTKAIQQLDKEFKRLPMTFEDAKTKIMNKATELSGAFARGLGLEALWTRFGNAGDDSMEQLLLKAEKVGIRCKNFILFIGDAFAPIVDLGKWAFDQLGIDAEKLGKEWHDLSAMFDWIMDLPTKMKNAAKQMVYEFKKAWAGTTVGGMMMDDPGAAPTLDALPSVARDRRNRLDTQEADWQSFVRSYQTGQARANQGSGNITVPGAGGSGGGERTDEQAYRAFIAELKKEGYIVNEKGLQGYRTTAQQAALYKKYGPGNAAPPGRSNHEFYKGVDLPANADPAKIEAAAARAGVRLTGSLRHGAGAGGDHRHQNFEKVSGSGDMWEDDQIEAMKKYDDALKGIRQSLNEVNMSKRDLAALDALENAGLERNINATDAQSRAVIESSNALYDAVENKRTEKEVNKQLEDSEWDLMEAKRQLYAITGDGVGQVDLEKDAIERAYQARLKDIEAIRDWTEASAEQLALRDKLIKKAEEQKAADLALTEARQFDRFATQESSLMSSIIDSEYAMEDMFKPEWERNYNNQAAQIARDLSAQLLELEKMYSTSSDSYKQLAALIQQDADLKMELLRKTTDAEKFQSYVGELQGLFQGLFTDAKGTMRQFFADLITKLLTAIAYAIIFKTTMAEGLQMSGGGGGLAGGILGTVLKTFAGALAGGITGGGASVGGGTPMFTPSNPGVGFAVGGTMKGGSMYRINEKGQELFMPGVDGRMITNKQLRGAMGNVAMSLGNTNITVNNSGTMDERALALHVVSAQERQMRNLIREEMRK